MAKYLEDWSGSFVMNHQSMTHLSRSAATQQLKTISFALILFSSAPGQSITEISITISWMAPEGVDAPVACTRSPLESNPSVHQMPQLLTTSPFPPSRSFQLSLFPSRIPAAHHHHPLGSLWTVVNTGIMSRYPRCVPKCPSAL